MSNKIHTEVEFQDALWQFINNEIIACGCVQAVIDTVNDDNTCDIKINDNIHTSVPMRVMVGSQSSIYEVPVVGSNCLVVFRDRKFNQPQLFWVDQVDQLLINCKTVVQFNGGQLGGMVKVMDLVTRLNKLENDINVLKQAFTDWVPVPNDGGAALKAASASWSGEELTPTVKGDIENTKIQQ